VQVDSIKPKLIPPRTKRLKLKCVILLSTFAFKFELRRYIKERLKWQTTLRGMVGRRRLTASKSVLKAPMLSALETILS